jgi:hypothetical protein
MIDRSITPPLAQDMRMHELLWHGCLDCSWRTPPPAIAPPVTRATRAAPRRRAGAAGLRQLAARRWAEKRGGGRPPANRSHNSIAIGSFVLPCRVQNLRALRGGAIKRGCCRACPTYLANHRARLAATQAAASCLTVCKDELHLFLGRADDVDRQRCGRLSHRGHASGRNGHPLANCSQPANTTDRQC